MKTKKPIIGLLFIMLMAVACRPAAVPTPMSASTAPAKQQSILNATETLTATAAPSTTSTKTVTSTFLPTNTLTSTPAPSNTPTLITGAVPCNLAAFVADITIPDGTLVSPGETFTKTWRLRNIGACTWTPDYKIVLVSDNLPGGPTGLNLSTSVAPGQTIDISLDLTAPTDYGTYQSYYKLADASGNVFGIGANGDSAFDVIVLDGVIPTASFAVIYAGIGGAALFSRFGGMQTLVAPYSIVLSFTSAALVGILFGFLPAQKAAQLDPIEALRHE